MSGHRLVYDETAAAAAAAAAVAAAAVVVVQRTWRERRFLGFCVGQKVGRGVRHGHTNVRNIDRRRGPTRPRTRRAVTETRNNHYDPIIELVRTVAITAGRARDYPTFHQLILVAAIVSWLKQRGRRGREERERERGHSEKKTPKRNTRTADQLCIAVDGKTMEDQSIPREIVKRRRMDAGRRRQVKRAAKCARTKLVP